MRYRQSMQYSFLQKMRIDVIDSLPVAVFNSSAHLCSIE